MPNIVTNSTVTIRLAIPQAILDRYEALAADLEVPVDALLIHQLDQMKSSVSDKAIVLDDSHRQYIERAIGHNLTDAASLVRHIERQQTLNVANVRVPLTPRLLERLHTRAIGVTFDKFLSSLIIRLLEEHAGLR